MYGTHKSYLIKIPSLKKFINLSGFFLKYILNLTGGLTSNKLVGTINLVTESGLIKG